VAESAHDALGHPVRINEPDQTGDLVEGTAAVRDHGVRRFDTQALDGFRGRHTLDETKARLNCRTLRLATLARRFTERFCGRFSRAKLGALIELEKRRGLVVSIVGAGNQSQPSNGTYAVTGTT
jgi:hypothetical protein